MFQKIFLILMDQQACLAMAASTRVTKSIRDEIELLSQLIEKYKPKKKLEIAS